MGPIEWFTNNSITPGGKYLLESKMFGIDNTSTFIQNKIIEHFAHRSDFHQTASCGNVGYL